MAGLRWSSALSAARSSISGVDELGAEDIAPPLWLLVMAHKAMRQQSSGPLFNCSFMFRYASPWSIMLTLWIPDPTTDFSSAQLAEISPIRTVHSGPTVEHPGHANTARSTRVCLRASVAS